MYEKLLTDNRGLLVWAARRYSGACQYDNAVDVEDLIQAGFIGLVNAMETYNESKGRWVKWALWFIEREINAELGRRDGQWVKAHAGALSLDAPLNDDSDETGLDGLADESLPPVDESLERSDDCRLVRECVSDLSDDRQREVVERWQLGGETQTAVAESLGISPQRVNQIWGKARKALARDWRLRQLTDLDDLTPFYRHVGVNTFRTTLTSATEHAALWRLDHEGGYPPPKSKAGKL
jgi:RNA polymerase sigma factor (sigma-70 family)